MHHREVTNLTAVLRQINALLATEPSERPLVRQEEAEDPACFPKFWISKWVDCSDKYGLVYQLCDKSVGVLFRDNTRLMMYADGDSLKYIDKKGVKSFVTVRSYPDTLHKKILCLKYYRSYMSAHLRSSGAGANMARHLRDVLVRLPWQLPYLRTWRRTQGAIVLLLSNRAVQINFLWDHTKLIFCPRKATVTYSDNGEAFRTFKLPLLKECGCSEELVRRIRYAKQLIKKLLRNQ